MLRYYITDRKAIGSERDLLRNIRRLGNAIDFIQVREKDLETRALVALVRRILEAAHPSIKVLVNDHADVAIAAGAHGVHLRTHAISPVRLRPILPSASLISVACHSIEDVRRAAFEQADLALLAPIFAAPGKGTPLGLEILRESARTSSVPILALGGIDHARCDACFAAGAAGIAGIRLFQSDSDPASY